MVEWSIETHSPEETKELAASLGRALEGGEVLALSGDLGAGKTCFVQGLAQGLDVGDDVYVRSPTFTLVDAYPGRRILYHYDLYRLSDVDELEAIGWRDCLDGEAVVAVEWANRLEEYLPEQRLELSIELGKEDSRRFRLRCYGDIAPTLQRWLKRWDSREVSA